MNKLSWTKKSKSLFAQSKIEKSWKKLLFPAKIPWACNVSLYFTQAINIFDLFSFSWSMQIQGPKGDKKATGRHSESNARSWTTTWQCRESAAPHLSAHWWSRCARNNGDSTLNKVQGPVMTMQIQENDEQ